MKRKIKKLLCDLLGHKLTARAFNFDGEHKYCERCNQYIRVLPKIINTPPMPKVKPPRESYADDTCDE